MNRYEKIYIDSLNLVPSRGRSVSDKITMRLQSLRAEKRNAPLPYNYGGRIGLYGICTGGAFSEVSCSYTTALRLARWAFLLTGFGAVLDARTMIILHYYK